MIFLYYYVFQEDRVKKWDFWCQKRQIPCNTYIFVGRIQSGTNVWQTEYRADRNFPGCRKGVLDT